MIRGLAILACVLTLCITAASAFIRHAQSGVGCDGWPQCYRTAVPVPAEQRSAIEGATPAIVAVRALHRVSAVGVGVLVLGLALFGWSRFGRAARVAVVIALADTVLLSWLGRYTPHDLPLVTIGNVVGGFVLAGAFGWIAASPARAPAVVRADRGGFALAAIAIGLLAVLACGGVMIGARHVIDACPALACAGDARLDPLAFDPRAVAPALDAAAARGMHVAHRTGALVFALLVAALALRMRRGPGGRGPALALVALVVVQAMLGSGTVSGDSPLASATAHNAVGALLAIVLAAVASRMTRTG